MAGAYDILKGLDNVGMNQSPGCKVTIHSNSQNLNTNDATAFPTAASIASEINAGQAALIARYGAANVMRQFQPIAVANPFENAQRWRMR